MYSFRVMKLLLILLLAISVVGCSSKASAKHNEKYYQTILCNELDGKMEVVLEDTTRVDCLTDEYAIEVDFAKKWAESIGQSLYYAEMTGKKPTVALIIGTKDNKYLSRLKLIADKYDIKIIKLKRIGK